MNFQKQCLAMLIGWLLFVSGAIAAPLELAGVKVDDNTTVAGSRLQLNGAGIRYKAIFQVYVGALYAGKKVASTEEFLAASDTRRLSLTMLREIDSTELGKAFIKGFQDNAIPAEMGKLLPNLVRIGQMFSEQKKLLPGDSITIDWVPAAGMVISIKGKAQGEPFKDVEFFNAMLRIWLGPNPADYKLKEALLGKPAAS